MSDRYESINGNINAAVKLRDIFKPKVKSEAKETALERFLLVGELKLDEEPNQNVCNSDSNSIPEKKVQIDLAMIGSLSPTATTPSASLLEGEVHTYQNLRLLSQYKKGEETKKAELQAEKEKGQKSKLSSSLVSIASTPIFLAGRENLSIHKSFDQMGKEAEEAKKTRARAQAERGKRKKEMRKPPNGS